MAIRAIILEINLGVKLAGNNGEINGKNTVLRTVFLRYFGVSNLFCEDYDRIIRFFGIVDFNI
jgi:hypothetical protein